jgi:subtilisin family serine protease
MMKAVISALLFVLLVGIGVGGEFVSVGVNKHGCKYLTNRFIVMINPETPPLITNQTESGQVYTGNDQIDVLCARNGVIKVEPYYPATVRNEKLRAVVERLYTFIISSEIDVIDIYKNFLANKDIESSDLWAVPELLYTPDDPLIDQQWHLVHTHTLEAWDIIRGDTTKHSIIGIVDSGINWEHFDLTPNIWVNEVEDINHNGILDPEDINGLDDDVNGYVDDVIGWDFADGDNNPMEDLPHGSGIAGCASEATDNGILGAGMGFSARLMCLKAINSQGQLVNGYQPMIYAAENGAQIINCSWGTFLYSQIEQNIINAVWEEDVLIIASAGANFNQQEMYPAAYEHVMAVAAIDQNDRLAPFSSFGTWIDICAPGVNIWTTWYDGFVSVSGTSFASPMVAGLAGLLRAWYPGYTNDEIQQLIEVSADSIDHLNPGFEGLLGAGRINALTCITTDIDNHQAIPMYFSLFQNYPNPFNTKTTFYYNLLKSSDVRLDIYNILGHKIETPVNENLRAGMHTIIWDAKDIPSGIYFYKLQAGDYSQSKKCLVLK